MLKDASSLRQKSLRFLLSVGLGATYAAPTDGRPVPGVYGQLDLGKASISGYATGVKTNAYFTSAYQLNYMRTWNAGDFLWGILEAGFGGGMYYERRGYKTADTVSTSDDVAIGPVVRAQWFFLGPVFVGVEGMYGLRLSLAHVLLSSQELGSMQVGVRF